MTANSMRPNVLPVAADDVATISKLADDIWRRHYAGIISKQQIDYMLLQRYQPELIATQLLQPDIWWRKLVLNQFIIGFSCCMRAPETNELKIDKLYIHCDHHRKGYGALLIADAIAIMRGRHLQALALTVNKRNHSAIAAYRHYGFEIAGNSIVDIGGGFFMDDYLMTLTQLHRWDRKSCD